MRLRVAASVLTLLCSWVMWEKWTYIDHGPSVITAVQETGTLLDCRKTIPNAIEQAVSNFQKHYKEQDYTIHSDKNAAFVTEKKGRLETVLQRYIYYCLPSTVDPYHDPR